MKISDLRNLIIEYRNTVKKFDNRSFISIPRELVLKADALEKKIKKVVEDKSLDQYLLVDIDKLLEYFSEKVTNCHNDNDSIFILKGNWKRYCVGELDKSEINLTCLVDYDNRSAWEELFNDYPGLEDYLWNLVENNIKAKKKKKLTLIQRKIKQNNKELEFYNDSEKIEKKIKDLTTGKESLEKKKKALETAIKEI